MPSPCNLSNYSNAKKEFLQHVQDRKVLAANINCDLCFYPLPYEGKVSPIDNYDSDCDEDEWSSVGFQPIKNKIFMNCIIF